MKEQFNKTRIKLKLSVSSDILEYPKSKVLVTVVDGTQIHELINNEFKTNFELSRLFSGNVRGFLKETNVNLEMKNTISNETSRFLSKNNGIVIVCDRLDLEPTGKEIVVTNPIVVNGQQTMSSIYLHANDMQKEEVKVQVKFIQIDASNEDEKENILLDIAKSSNTANNVDELDLLSNRKLMKKLRQAFIDQRGIYLKIKDGEILNDIFFQNTKKVDFVEVLKIWVTVYLKRPSDAKATKNNIRIFTKAFDKSECNSKYTLLADDLNYNKIEEMFLISHSILELRDEKIRAYFAGKPYYEHAQYFIIYLLCEFLQYNFKDIFQVEDQTLSEIKNQLENLIDQEKKAKLKQDLEFTYNNYFKSQKPQNDYLKVSNSNSQVETVDVMIGKLFS